MDERYAKQRLFAPIADVGQQQLAQSAVAIIGCGALGSAIAETLVRAGVGTVHLADRDYVEYSNLQRQQLFTEQDALEKMPKVVAAEKRLRDIRNDTELHTYLQHVDDELITYLAKNVALLIDATDNFETRLLINDAAYKYEIPWIYGACVGSSGVVFPFRPGETACLRCLLPTLPLLNATCDTAGIIAPAVQVTAALQCAETLKILTGNREAIRTKVHHFDCWHNHSMDIGIARIQNPQCETCSDSATFPSLEKSNQDTYAVLCGRDAVQIIPSNRRMTLRDAELAAVKRGLEIRRTPYFIEVKKDPHRLVIFKDGRLLIHGLRNIDEGRKMYVELFG